MEFQAIICCGKGARLSPISAIKPTGVPKPLLPVAQKPMIEYALEWCDKAPFKEVIVVTDSSSFNQVNQVVKNYAKNRNKDIVPFTSVECLSMDAETTGEVIHLLRDRLTSDFVLLPCDFITDLPPQVLIEAYRNRADSDIAMAFYHHNPFENVEKTFLKTNYTIYSEEEDGHFSLLDLHSKTSVELNKALEIRTHMAWRYPRAIVSSKLLESFIYFCSHKIMQISEGGISASKSSTKIMRDFARRSWRHRQTRETVGMFIMPREATFARCNNIPVYTEANRWFMKLQAKNNQGAQVSKEKGAAVIGADASVGNNTEIGERTNVKRSVVGNNCKVGMRCRLTGCIILDNVTIADDVTLENCIVGLGATVNTKARLTNCNIEGGFVAPKGLQAKGENLMSLSLDGLIHEEALSESGYSDLYSDDDGDEAMDDEEEEEYEDEFSEDDGLFDR
ncbi:Translation initiation factor eIF-2B subunit gamma [Komagataella phaffii CBS 7435]|uniref:Translation initiation factor eIF2B subunit gamma n=2 Tax=Komagataella phaffii TaxID=460519 RepID=C4R7Q9_KOMPG|nr:Gamma subunit of the translation initiation factor eIF2B [Komagataella phaffii GS115]AOA65328.1 GQ67_04734T0 [Komagataella phaffii]CAH2450984.1 Translation initiation factor eIF-2B subunit gamma [Komagataella phaffii CBS 7435]AOA70101.1 GQ68_04706T0 [Komagataella phaffii GS115]CAY71634.1 Gamma subunit of the translation initiation factor eIF2B [Komagataella phaffii GS115]CCA40763.1 Translation initiation factor eIF-2B subunit gamma [Komagataella phaffii CBS 7435]